MTFSTQASNDSSSFGVFLLFLFYSLTFLLHFLTDQIFVFHLTFATLLILLWVQFIRFLTILFYLLTFCTLFCILSRLKIYWKLKPVPLDNTQGNLRRVFYRSPFYIKNVTKLKVWQCRYEKHDPCLIECLALYTFAVD